MKIPRLILLALITLSLLGAAAILLSTRWGPWAYSDSTTYLVAARSLLEGEGLNVAAHPGSVERLTHHPPLYPLLLSAIGLCGVELLDAARWLNVILFGATIFTTGFFSYRLLRSGGLALSISALLFAMPTLLDMFSGAMSEPLFLFASLSGTFLIIQFLETRQRRTLILAAAAAGLAFLTRYIGIFAIATGLLALGLLYRASWKERGLNLLLYGLVSLLPNAAWWLYVYLSTTTYAARELVSQTSLGGALIELRLLLVEAFWQWLPFTQSLTYSYNTALKLLLGLGVLSLLPYGVWMVKTRKKRQAAAQYGAEFRFLATWCLFSLAYFACLAYAYLYTTPTPDIDLRMLLPIQSGLLIALCSGSLLALKALHIPRWGSLGVLGLALLYLGAFLPASLGLVRQYTLHGDGYTSAAWHESNTLEALKQLPIDTPLITNQAAAVLLWTDRPAYDFCRLPCDQPEHTRYGDNPADETQVIFRQQGAALVLFYPFCAPQEVSWNVEWMAEVEALTRDLTVYEYSCDGAIYFYP